MCFAPTTACTFSTSQLPKVVRRWCALHILAWTCASRHNGVQLFISHLTTWLCTRRFSEPTFRPSGTTNHWKDIVLRDTPTSSRTCMFFLLTLSLLWLFPPLLFHLSILSERRLLKFLRSFIHSFRSVPFRSVSFRSVPFRSVPFRSMPCHAMPCHATIPFHPFIHPFIHSFIHSFIRACTRPLTQAFRRAVVLSFIDSIWFIVMSLPSRKPFEFDAPHNRNVLVLLHGIPHSYRQLISYGQCSFSQLPSLDRRALLVFSWRILN